MKAYRVIFIVFFVFFCSVVWGQNDSCKVGDSSYDDSVKVDISSYIESFFIDYKKECRTGLPVAMSEYNINIQEKTINIYAKEGFASQVFTPQKVRDIYKKLKSYLPSPYNSYNIKIYGHNVEINNLIPNLYRSNKDFTRLWETQQGGQYPWVKNVSTPLKITKGLSGIHLTVWPSHGRYFDFKKNKWIWQRPSLYCTTEDLFTRSFVVPFLLPMLENAGAVVYSPRERDMHSVEIIVDNDSCNIDPGGVYGEIFGIEPFNACEVPGFAKLREIYTTNQNPHIEGSARVAMTTENSDGVSTANWVPSIPEDGEYALYVTYPTLPLSVPDAEYTIRHRNVETKIKVNQRIGGGTWVYLGTFDFSKGCSLANSISLSNYSEHPGMIAADAIRIGGGMGNIAKNGKPSGLPRYLEGALYYAQWAGMPYDVYNTKDGRNDYSDDINVRSNTLNYLAGGSSFVPDSVGLKVPMELSLAVHSDAGYRTDNSVVGTLSIYTHCGDRETYDFKSGVSRLASSDFASIVQDDICRDLSYNLGREWNRRELYNRNYSESRKPEVPSMILETLSHQNFQDMLYGHDPNFKFLISRAIYKAITRFVATQHQVDYTIQPLPVSNFAAEVTDSIVHLTWSPQIDSLEPSATPTSFIVYTSTENDGFDNGRLIYGKNNCVDLPIKKDVLYRFKVTACNDGGESFPSEVLTVLSASKETHKILIINGFTRLSSPAVVSNADSLGFDIKADIGVPYINTAEYCGAQTGFLRSKIGIETSGGLGFSGRELEGQIIAGNNFNYPSIHAQAMRDEENRYSISSCSMGAVNDGIVALGNYQMVDIIFGLQKDDKQSSIYSYKTFTPKLQRILSDYLETDGNIMVSGAYVGTDMNNLDEQIFTANTLNYTPVKSIVGDNVLMNDKEISITKKWNPNMYAVQYVDVLNPIESSESLLKYKGGNTAAVVSSNSVVMGFPFESITSVTDRSFVMKRILQRLLLKL